jgi:MFS family permease
MGILGISLSLGASSAPLLGSWVASTAGLDAMFYLSSGLAVLSIMVLMNMPETLVTPRPFSWRLLRIGKEDLYDPAALPAGIVMVFCYVCYGVVLTMVPDLSDHLGVSNRGTFFAIFTLSSASTRIFAGRISDRVGRVPVLKVSAWVLAFSMVLMAFADQFWVFCLGGILFGFGNGIFSPAINAWTVDLSAPHQRGRALATMYIALEIAIGAGAFFSGWYFGSQVERMPTVFLFAAFFSILGWMYLHFFWKPGSGRKVPTSMIE